MVYMKLAHLRLQLPPDAKASSIESDEPASPMSGIPNTTTPIPHFDLDKTFPAVLAPLSLLRGIPESQDIDALRALAPVFCHCLDAILHSMAGLLNHMPTSPKYHLALNGVNSSKDMFLGHVNQITIHGRSSSRREAIHLAMQHLDAAMSSLKCLLNVATFEAAQLKPLPLIPPDGGPPRVSDESTSLSQTHSSVESRERDLNLATLVSNSTEKLHQSPKSKISTFFKPLSLRRRTKSSPGLDSAPLESATSMLAKGGSEDLTLGYVHVSVNIRNSLARFPVLIDSSVSKIPHPEDTTELWKDRNGLVQLASLKALVRYMTNPDADNDAEIVNVFFLCFRFFSNPKETFEALIARYDGDRGHQSPFWTESHSMHVKLRIAKLFYLWVDLHWRVEDSDVLVPLTQFAFSRLAKDIPQEASSKLVSSLHERACAGQNSRGLRKEKTVARVEARCRQELLCSNWTPRWKKSVTRCDSSDIKLQDFLSPEGHTTLALQLTLLLWEKYRAFEPEDAVRYLMTRTGEVSENPPTSDIARKVENFMSYEKAVHRFVMNSIGTAESVQVRTELTEFFLELATACHELRNYSASCLIAFACDRPTVLPFITKIKLSPSHERMRGSLTDFYTRENQHMASYKQALQSCRRPALPGMMLLIQEVARGCGAEPYDQHPTYPGPPLINLKRYRPLTWAVRAMEKCHAPFKIQRVDYIYGWLEHVLSEYLVGTETEWEQRIYNNWCVSLTRAKS